MMKRMKVNAATSLDLGYRFSPPCHPGHLDYRQLDITLHTSPTFRHFDPEQVSFWIAPDLLGNFLIKIRHPWKGRETYQILTGRVRMRDRDGKVVEAFTFGGELQIASSPESTHCTLRSPAPILLLDPLDQNLEIESILTDEVEILLAENRETWEEEHPGDEFEQQLADADPLGLYLGCIQATDGKFHQFPRPLPELYIKFMYFLQHESHRLQEDGHWRQVVSRIPQFLGLRNV